MLCSVPSKGFHTDAAPGAEQTFQYTVSWTAIANHTSVLRNKFIYDRLSNDDMPRDWIIQVEFCDDNGTILHTQLAVRTPYTSV